MSESQNPDDAGAPAGAPGARRRIEMSSVDRASIWLLGLYLLVAVPLVMVWNRNAWFTWDDWWVFERFGLNPHDLFSPYNGHLCALPFTVLLGMFHLDGVHTYLPNQLLVVLSHVALCVVLWLVIARTGVRPWLASLVVALFVMFGSGSENIVNGFQITFVWPLLFGLVALLLVDRDDPTLGRRDVLALAFGAAALLSSGVALPMIVAVACTALLRRGWRAAVFQGLPLLGAYVVWYVSHTVTSGAQVSGSIGHRVQTVLIWTLRGSFGAFQSLTLSRSIVPVAMLVVVVVGLVVLVRSSGASSFRDERTKAWALALGAVLFTASVGFGRGVFSSQFARSPRYVYVTTAFLLPLVALSMDALRRRSRGLFVVAAVLVLAGVPHNIHALARPNKTSIALASGSRTLLLAYAASPLAQTAPPDLQPVNIGMAFRGFSPTIGWLAAEERAGRLPAPPRISESAQGDITLTLGLTEAVGAPITSRCHRGRKYHPVRISPSKGSTISVHVSHAKPTDRVVINLVDARRRVITSKELTATTADRLLVRAPGMHLRITSTAPSFELCQG